MAQPKGKRLKTCLPTCTLHQPLSGKQVKQNYPLSVEEAVCGLITFFYEVSYRFQALMEIFEQDDVALPRVAAYFRKITQEEEKNAQTLLDYQTERGGHYCPKNIQKTSQQRIHRTTVTISQKIQIGQCIHEVFFICNDYFTFIAQETLVPCVRLNIFLIEISPIAYCLERSIL
ncbi:ferritin light chain, oocyte isoform-like isoform X2 [Mobula hypostoma]|uniref:ferritin light chain, oocyte isoform-like isoform X2 n=1 Tax=Mobula hypostoma TaxID=723540 RepID=UPI002FC36AF8